MSSTANTTREWIFVFSLLQPKGGSQLRGRALDGVLDGSLQSSGKRGGGGGGGGGLNIQRSLCLKAGLEISA